MVYVVLNDDFYKTPFAVFGHRESAEIMLRAMGLSDDEIDSRIIEVPYIPTRFSE